MTMTMTMTRAEIKTAFEKILQEQAGMPVGVLDDATTLEGDLGLMSLDMASLQLALEDTFGLVFADGTKAPGDIDRAWAAMKTVGQSVDLIEKFMESK